MRKISLNNIYYLLSSFYLFSILLGIANVESIFGLDIGKIQAISRYVVLAVLLLLFFAKNITVKMRSLLAMSIVFIIIAMCYIKIDDAIMVLTMLFIFCGKGIRTKDLAKYLYKTVEITTLFFVFLCLIGVSPDIYVARSGSERIGHSMGFIGSNACASTIFIGLVYYFYSNKGAWTRKKTLLYGIIAVATYMITKSRMTFLMECMLILLWKIYRIIKNERIIYSLQKYSYFVGAFISLILTLWYGKNPNGIIQQSLNSFTTGRLYWCNYFFERYNVSLFGQNIDLVGLKAAALTGSSWQSIDNTYIMLAIHYGVCILIFFCILCVILGRYLEKNKDAEGSICVLILALWGLTENSIIIIGYNIAFYLIAEMLWNGVLKTEKEINKQ